jgi:hypothetical protein
MIVLSRCAGFLAAHVLFPTRKSSQRRIKKTMKKVFTALCILAVAFTLSVPAFAKHHKYSKGAASTTETGKAHKKHSTKKGATEGQKGTAPAQQ